MKAGAGRGEVGNYGNRFVAIHRIIAASARSS
jgi:hypothetical protein